MSDLDVILQRLSAVPTDPEIVAMRSLLMNAETRLLRDRSAQLSVSEAKSLWGTRMANEDITGQSYAGLERLLRRLGTLTPERPLEQFAFVAKDRFGNLFFDATSGEYLGVAVAARVVL